MKLVTVSPNRRVSAQYGDRRLRVGPEPAEFSKEEAVFLLRVFSGSVIQASKRPNEAKQTEKELGTSASEGEAAVPVDYSPDTEAEGEKEPLPGPSPDEPYYCTKCEKIHSKIGSKVYKQHKKHAGGFPES